MSRVPTILCGNLLQICKYSDRAIISGKCLVFIQQLATSSILLNVIFYCYFYPTYFTPSGWAVKPRYRSVIFPAMPCPNTDTPLVSR
ncbi:7920_t:CDS:2 [Funneliformis mosseae]|uniref:7920_t:CDS:1 n=1 Tax=Funneliformis mosseae TaxID=27381 RepID=A0A9N8ZKI5_FUNMO|nr:7920_t:CDS:2 [Funneliformis mosseae]